MGAFVGTSVLAFIVSLFVKQDLRRYMSERSKAVRESYSMHTGTLMPSI